MLLKVYRAIYHERVIRTTGRAVVELPNGKFSTELRNGLYIAKSELVIDDRGQRNDFFQESRDIQSGQAKEIHRRRA